MTATTAQTTRALLAKAAAAGKTERPSDRDSQRQKVYTAERVIRTWHFAPSLTEKQVLALVKKVTTSAYVIRHYGAITPVVHFGTGSGSSWAMWDGSITLSRAGLNIETVLHELTHLYTMHHGRGHGWLFCKVLLDLVRKFMGQEAHDLLKAAFRCNKVKFSTPSSRTLTPEQREAARERLAAARAKRAPSTGEWVVAVQFKHLDGLRYIESMSKYRLGVTRYTALAMVRKTDAAALKLLNEVKRHCWRSETVVLVNRLTMEVRSAA